MGYTLRIGNAEIDHTEEDIRFYVEVIKIDSAPAHGDPTDFTNERWPSYSAWHEFCRALGITDLMFNQRNGGAGSFSWNGVERSPLIQEHPGCAPITAEHLSYLSDAIEKYKASHPDHVAVYGVANGDSHLCRAEWLQFWMDWALRNCKFPVMTNS